MSYSTKHTHSEKLYSNVFSLSITKNLFQKVTTLEQSLTNLIETENREKLANICPICIDPFETNNYIIPLCGHKMCIPCFANNLIKNNQTGNRCSLCREIIIPGI